MIYLIVVSTDSYSGNFERELCAYLTNVVDHYGGAYSKISYPDNVYADWWEKNIIPVVYMRDIYKEYRPMAMRFETRSRCFTGVEFKVGEKPSYEMLDFFLKKSNEFCSNYLELKLKAEGFNNSFEKNIKCLGITLYELDKKEEETLLIEIENN